MNQKQGGKEGGREEPRTWFLSTSSGQTTQKPKVAAPAEARNCPSLLWKTVGWCRLRERGKE